MNKKELFYGEETVLYQKKVPESHKEAIDALIREYLKPLRKAYKMSYVDESNKRIELSFTSKIEARKAQFELSKKGYFVNSEVF